jgi:hypothetical protein
MIIKVRVDDETWARMTSGRRVEGTIGYDKWTGENDFNAFHRKSREPGCERENMTLYETDNGRLTMSKKRFVVRASAKKNTGRERSATSLMMTVKELTDYLKHTKTIEEIMDNV